MKQPLCSLPTETLQRQAFFWPWIDREVQRLVAEAARVFRCPSREAAREAAGLWRQRWQRIAPVAVAHFLEDLCDSVSFYDLPITWWKRVRTNNPLERLIRTLRQRPGPMGCFHDETAIERAVFGQLLRRRKIKLTHNT